MNKLKIVKKKLPAFLTGILLLGLGIFLSMIGLTTPDCPAYEKVRSNYTSSDLYLMDNKGEPLHQWRQNKNERSFSWLPVNEIPPTLITAILKSEDKNYFSHAGIDFKAVIASVYQRLFKNSSRGSSTISMQLIKLIAPNKNIYQGFLGKLRQYWAAFLLEARWNKNQILEAYLNLVPLRGEYRGIHGISWSLFHKKPSGLTLKESTFLAVLIRSPNASPVEWAQRACWQENEMCSQFQESVLALNQKFIPPLPDQYALHLAQKLNHQKLKGEVITTIRKDVQVLVTETIRSQIQNLENQNAKDAAVIVIENETGEVWAYVGGTGLHPESKYVDGIQAFRQVGSTLKPFLYATAFEKKLVTADSWIEDSAVDIVFDSGAYTPQNHDRQFYGWVKVKTALASSLNVPAVKVFKLLNDDSFWSKLRDLEFRNLKESEHYGPALALGVADLNLEDLTQAYRVIARKGLYSPLKFLNQEKSKIQSDLPSKPQTSESRRALLSREKFFKTKRVFSESSATEVQNILSESQNRALSFGLDSALNLPGTAVKTGTSKDMRDNWCIGFNSRFTVGVWVGNFSGEPMWNVIGVTGAAPIWKKVMEYLQQNYPTNKELRFKNNFVKSDEPEVYPQIRIVYPQDGMIMALDPSIPVANQKMPLLTEGFKKKKIVWKIDGKLTVSANEPYLWTPQTGRHKFELYEEDRLTQSVQVLVK